jgi:glycosyltransferase 2 family protein
MDKNRTGFWIGILFSITSLAAIFLIIEPKVIWDALKTVNVGYVLLIAGGIVVFLMIRAVRWRFLLGNRVSWREVFHIQNIGYMLNMVLPLRAGDVARAALIGNVPPATVASGISTTVMDRVLDILFTITFLPFTLTAVSTLPAWMRDGALGAGIAAIGLILVFVVAVNQRPFTIRITTTILNRIKFLNSEQWIRRLHDLLDGLDTLTRLKDAAILIFLSIVVWIPIFFAYDIGLQAVGLKLPFLHVGFVVCAAMFSVALPSSPGQIGVFHGGVTAAAVFLRNPEGVAASFAIVYHATNLAVMIIMGLIGLSGIGATFNNVLDSVRRFRSKSKVQANA